MHIQNGKLLVRWPARALKSLVRACKLQLLRSKCPGTEQALYHTLCRADAYGDAIENTAMGTEGQASVLETYISYVYRASAGPGP